MTMVTFTDSNRTPVLIADSLISGPDDESALITPDHPRGISEVFPPRSGFVPTRLARKTALINSNLAIAMSGSVLHMRVFREDVRAHFRDCTDCRPGDAEQFLQQYRRDPDGSIVLNHIRAFLLSTCPISEDLYIYCLLPSHADTTGLAEADSRNLGKVLATGCGAQDLLAAVRTIDGYKLDHSGPPGDRSPREEAIGWNLCLIAQLHKLDEATGQMLLAYWGGGYEVIYREAGNGLTYLRDYTIFFWTLDLDDEDAVYRPDGILKYQRRDDASILLSYRQGVFNLQGMVDVGMPSPRNSFLKRDREFLNSDVHMNLVCTHVGNEITGMYHFFHRYNPGEASPTMAVLGKDGKAEVLIQEELCRDMSRSIRDSEARRRREHQGA